jgi:N-acetylated-alpha-linked acidic dipeptidase
MESALAASRDYATHPHLAGAVEDPQDAQDILALFQSEFGMPTPATEPIYLAGSPSLANSKHII